MGAPESLTAFRRWMGRTGHTLIPGRLMWWRSSSGKWGWTQDAYGPVYRIGHLAYYPKENRSRV